MGLMESNVYNSPSQEARVGEQFVTTFRDSPLFIDEAVGQQLVGLVESAKINVMFVSPYLKLWGHLKNAIELAAKRGIDVNFLVRDEEEVTDSEDVRWLRSKKVKVLGLERLHSKIYTNESTVLISSMNLTESSAKNSLEIALKVTDPQTEKELRAYINERLIPLSKPVGQPLGQLYRAVKSVLNQQSLASCIRCKKKLSFEPERPLCDDCYDLWVQYGDRTHLERVCHSCGKQAEVSYSRPLCQPCFSKA